MMKKIVLALVALSVISACKIESGKQSVFAAQDSTKEQEVNVYTHRHYESDQDVFEKFEAQTGIKIRVINASANELIQKMKMEGEQLSADVLITVDAGRISRAKEQGLMQPIESEILEKSIYVHLRDADHQ